MKVGAGDVFRIKRTIPPIQNITTSSQAFELATMPQNINPDSDILTLRFLDGLNADLKRVSKLP